MPGVHNLLYNDDELKNLINSYLNPAHSEAGSPSPNVQSNGDSGNNPALPETPDIVNIPTAISNQTDLEGLVTVSDIARPNDLALHTPKPQRLAPRPERPVRHPNESRMIAARKPDQPEQPQQQRKLPQKRSYDVSGDDSAIKRPEERIELDTGPEDIDIDFDFDGEYEDVPEDRPLRPRREKRTGCIGGVLYSAFVISISLVLASLLWMATVDVLGFGNDNELVSVTVPDGFTIDDIADILYDAGLIRYRFLFIIFADFSEAEEKISPGAYVLNMSYDYRALVQGMTARAGVREETTVTIPEGFSQAQVFNLLEEYGVTPASELWETARNHSFNFGFLEETEVGDRLRLEGFMFPDTYNFFIDSPPELTLNRLLREFDRRFSDEMHERAEEMGYTVREIITIASMIEREAGSDEERSRISAVIYNRLENWTNPLLQIDATIHYAIAGTDRIFDIEMDSLYNTYIHAGLPPGPIANPGMASIHAALYPESTNEFYYALNRQDTHEFFRTYDEQRAFVNSPEYGGR